MGNHDYFQGAAADIASELRKQGITVLRNESFFPFGKDQGLEILGVDDNHREDLRNHKSQIFVNPQTTIPRIILTHRPDSASMLSALPGSTILQLSGHSHGGQICLPSFSSPTKGGYPVLGIVDQIMQKFPFLYVPKSIRNLVTVVDDWDLGRSGLHQFKPRENYFVHTSGGLATHPPFRFMCPPEISYFVISRK